MKTKQKFIPLEILNSNEKREIENKLKFQFGIEKIPGVILKRGKERLFLFSGDIKMGEIKDIEKIIVVERVGFYFAKIVEGEDAIRLSIEGSQILQGQIKKNIFEINDKQAEDWMNGRDLQIKTGERKFLIIKNNEDFLGCGKASTEKIGNFIPKNRRLKSKEI